MSKRAWMPLYVGDYLGDTGHLSTVQHGAYFLLMMHYWRQGALPDDDKQLAAITKLPLRVWLDIRETIQAFFYGGWLHKRIDEELAVMEQKTAKRATAGQKGGLRAAMNRMLMEDAARRSNATAVPQQGVATVMNDHSHSPRLSSSSFVAAREKKLGNEPNISPELAALLAREKPVNGG